MDFFYDTKHIFTELNYQINQLIKKKNDEYSKQNKYTISLNFKPKILSIGKYDFDGDIVFKGQTPRYEISLILLSFNMSNDTYLLKHEVEIESLKIELMRSV